MNIPELNRIHLAFLQDHIAPGPIVDSFSTKVPRDWAMRSGQGAYLPARVVNRQDLFNLASDVNVPSEAVCWSVLAWGGMHGAHRDRLLDHKNDRWLRLADDIRAGQFNRSGAYNEFSKLKAERVLKGIGPAYFTKLIFFLMPRLPESHTPGYIMDQWVGSSVNLLADREVVLMNRLGTWKKTKTSVVLSTDLMVSDLNDGVRYEEYCSYIEAIGRVIHRSGAETEQLMMSSGGRKKQSWRGYVKSQRDQFYFPSTFLN